MPPLPPKARGTLLVVFAVFRPKALGGYLREKTDEVCLVLTIVSLRR